MEGMTPQDARGPAVARRVPGSRVALAPTGVRVGVPGPAASADVHVIKEGDDVRRIEITCSCGHTITLICEQE